MKRMFTVLISFIMIISIEQVSAQKSKTPVYSPALTGDEQPDLSSNPVIEVSKGHTFAPVRAGDLTFEINLIDPSVATGHDWHTNTSAQSVWLDVNTPDNIHAVFTQSNQTTAWSDRTCLYYGSTDGGSSWFQLGQVPVYINSGDGRAGFAVIYGNSDGAAVIANHNNTGGGDIRTKIYIDANPFEYDFTQYDPLVVPWEPNSPLHPRMVVDGEDNVVFISSQHPSGGPYDSSFTNVLFSGSGSFNGWNSYDGNQGEAYAIAVSESGSKIGMIYEGQALTNQYSDILYRESTDGGLTWSTPLMVWDVDTSNPDSMIGTWRGIDIEFLGEEPRAVFEIGVITDPEGFYPDYPSAIYFWSPVINNGISFAIADTTNVPFYTNGRGNHDWSLNMGKPCIGRSQHHGYLFVSFSAASGEIWTQTPDSTAYFAGFFMYSSDGGETWTNPVKITPDDPVMDWRSQSIVPVSPVSPGDNDMIRIHMVMQGDTIPGSNVNAAGTTMPLAVSGQFYHYTTTISVVNVNEIPSAVNEFTLEQNYPNPFNPKTNIGFRISDFGFVTLKVYDLLGREIATLVNEEKPTGSYKAEFDASQLSSGVYIYRLTAGSFSASNKMTLLK